MGTEFSDRQIHIRRVCDRRDLWRIDTLHAGAFDVPVGDPHLMDSVAWKECLFAGRLPNNWTLHTQGGMDKLASDIWKFHGDTGIGTILVAVESSCGGPSHTVFCSMTSERMTAEQLDAALEPKY